jgi:nucleoid DNA-binding protein
MNRSELVKVVAHQTGLDSRTVDNVFESMIGVLAQMLNLGEEVHMRKLGKWRVGERDLTDVRSPRTGEPLGMANWRVVIFTPSANLKMWVNSENPVTRPPSRSVKALITVDKLHRLLWDRADGDRRLHVGLTLLREELGVTIPAVRELVAQLKHDGRIRFVETRSGKRVIYEIADPDTWQAGDTETHVQRQAKPAWG